MNDNDGIFSIAPRNMLSMNSYLNHTKNKRKELKTGISRALKTGLLQNSAFRTGRVFYERAVLILFCDKTHYRPAMPFGIIYLRGSFQVRIVTV